MDFWGSLQVPKTLVTERTRVFGFCKNAEKARIVAVLQKKFRQSPRLLTSQAPRNNQ